MEFLTSLGYWLLCIPVLVILVVATFTSVHPKILERRPTALAWNNLMIIFGIGLLIAVFVIHSWRGGGFTLILCVIALGVAARVRERLAIRRLIDQSGKASHG